MPDESFPPTSPFLTVQEVALYTRLSPRHIRRLIARGELRVTRKCSGIVHSKQPNLITSKLISIGRMKPTRLTCFKSESRPGMRQEQTARALW